MRTLICLALVCFSAQSFATATATATATGTGTGSTTATTAVISCHTTYKKALAAYKAEIAQARMAIEAAYKDAQSEIAQSQIATAEEFKSCHNQARLNYDLRIRTAKNNQEVLAVIAQHETESRKCGTDYAENMAATYSQFADDVARAQSQYNANVVQARTNYDLAVQRCL